MNIINRRILATLCFATSCSVIESIPILSEVNKTTVSYLAGVDELQYSQEFINQQTYASINAKLGRSGNNALLILSYIKEEFYEYVSADGVTLTLLEGMVVRSEGFQNDFHRIIPQDLIDSIQDSQSKNMSAINNNEYYGFISFTDPQAYELATVSKLSLAKQDELVLINGIVENVTVLEELIYIPAVKRNIKATYWVGQGMILKQTFNSLYLPTLSLKIVKAAK